MMQDEKRKKMDARQEFLKGSKNTDADYYVRNNYRSILINIFKRHICN